MERNGNTEGEREKERKMMQRQGEQKKGIKRQWCSGKGTDRKSRLERRGIERGIERWGERKKESD